MFISKEMENVHIDSLRGLLAPSILEWLEDGQQSISGLFDDCTNADGFFDSLPEAELSELERNPLKAVASTSEFKTASNEELKRLVESNLNTKYITLGSDVTRNGRSTKVYRETLLTFQGRSSTECYNNFILN